MKLLKSDEDLILNILKFWQGQWDFECPTLFGISEIELDQVVSQWPEGFRSNNRVAARAVSGGFGELLWGASSITDAKSLMIFGKKKNEIESLYMNQISEEIKLYRDD